MGKTARYDEAMRTFLTSWLIMTIAAAVMVAVVPGMTAVGEPPILGIAAFALFMALINASIKPIVHLISLPFAILTLGILTLIINWLFMRLASWLAVSLFGVGVYIDGFWWSVIGSLIMTIVSGIVSAVVGR
jgi:putative membrane protein